MGVEKQGGLLGACFNVSGKDQGMSGGILQLPGFNGKAALLEIVHHPVAAGIDLTLIGGFGTNALKAQKVQVIFKSSFSDRFVFCF
jgi:hypothetical protein